MKSENTTDRLNRLLIHSAIFNSLTQRFINEGYDSFLKARKAVRKNTANGRLFKLIHDKYTSEFEKEIESFVTSLGDNSTFTLDEYVVLCKTVESMWTGVIALFALSTDDVSPADNDKFIDGTVRIYTDLTNSGITNNYSEHIDHTHPIDLCSSASYQLTMLPLLPELNVIIEQDPGFIESVLVYIKDIAYDYMQEVGIPRLIYISEAAEK